MEKRIFICQQCGAELCADEVDGMLGHAVPDFDNAGDVYGCNQCGPCEVVPDRAIAYIAALEQQLAAAQERNTALQSEHLDHVNALNNQLAAAQERERMLNDELYYACELAIAYAHSEKDKEWAAEIIEALTPPEQEE